MMNLSAVETEKLVAKIVSLGRSVKSSRLLCALKNRICDTWNSGARGKSVLVIMFTAFLVAVCSLVGGAGDKTDHFFQLGKNDLKTRYRTDEMFVATNRADLVNGEVVANPRTMPRWIAKDRLEWMVCANSGVEKRSHRIAYLACERDFTIAHVEGDHVIVKSGRDDYGYIKTDEEYVEGNYLKPGLYRFIGNRTVPLITGSSVRMHAFEMIDPDVSSAVYEAFKWNLQLENVVEAENRRRSDARCRIALDDILNEKIKHIVFPTIAEMIRYPIGAEAFVKKVFAEYGSDVDWQCKSWSGENEKVKGKIINGWIRNHKNDELLKFTNTKINGSYTGEKIANDIKDRLEREVWHMCYYDIPENDNNYLCYMVRPDGNDIRKLHGDGDWEEVRLSSKFYIVKVEDEKHFSLNMDVNKFVDKYNELYGMKR